MSSIVFQHHKNGTDYAYVSTSYWDKEKKTNRTKMVCIGKRSPHTGEIIYNKRWRDLQAEKEPTSEDIVPVPICSTASIGPGLLLETVTTSLGLRRSLLKGFDEITVDQLLSLAWFLAASSEQRAYLAEGWMESHVCPLHDQPLTSPRISELLQTLTRDQILSFFSSWMRRITDREYLCFDITSISSMVHDNPYIEWGYNRDTEKLPQINIALLAGMESELPSYYEILPGSLHDVKSLPAFLDMMKKLGMKKINLMMDKGFYSQKNLDLMAERDIRFTIPVKKNTKRVKVLIDKYRDTLELPEHIVIDDEDHTVYGITSQTKLKNRKIYYHVYMDTAKRIDHVRKFNRYIVKLSKELESKELVAAHTEDYAAFFTVKDTPKRGRKVVWNQEAIRHERDNYIGYWVLVTTAEADAGRAHIQYSKRDHVEKQFDSLKNLLEGNRLRVQKPISAEAIVFLRFLALIITERIRTILRTTPIKANDPNPKFWISRYTVPEVFNRLESFTEVKFKHTYKPVRPSPTKAQTEIFKIFGLQ